MPRRISSTVEMSSRCVIPIYEEWRRPRVENREGTESSQGEALGVVEGLPLFFMSVWFYNCLSFYRGCTTRFGLACPYHSVYRHEVPWVACTSGTGLISLP